MPDPKSKPAPQPPIEDEDADPVGDGSDAKTSGESQATTPGLERVEDAADRVERPAKEPADRTGELLQKENDLSSEGIVGPEKQFPPGR